MLSDWAIKKLENITHLHLNCPEETCYGVLAVIKHYYCCCFIVLLSFKYYCFFLID